MDTDTDGYEQWRVGKKKKQMKNDVLMKYIYKAYKTIFSVYMYFSLCMYMCVYEANM